MNARLLVQTIRWNRTRLLPLVLAGFGWMEPLYRTAFGPLEPLIGPYGQSLAFAIAFVAVWAAIVWALDRRGWYWKV